MNQDESQKKVESSNGRCVGRSNNNANANGGLVYSNANNASSNSNANDGSRLTLTHTSTPAGDDAHRHTQVCNEIAGEGGEELAPRQTSLSESKEESGKIPDAPEGDGFPFDDVEEPIAEPPQYPLPSLIAEIITEENLSDSFDYVISHLEHQRQRDKYRPKKERYIKQARRMIGDGSYRIRRDAIREIEVFDGNKRRTVQVTTVFDRFCCHSVMVIVEKYCYPSLIKNAAASVKGRGTHWLHNIHVEDINAVPDMCKYYCQTDATKFYDNIDQELMKGVVREYISDELLLPILDDFITLIPKGLSKGLRSSQVFANLYMTPIDNIMIRECERYVLEHKDGSEELRFLYARYMDDAYWWSGSKKECWRLFTIYKAECEKRGLKVKGNYAVRPLSEGFDALGYRTIACDGTKNGKWCYARVRRRIKTKFARKTQKVKSRKRTQKLVASFKGVAMHCEGRHLMRKLIPNHYMAKFSELNFPEFTPKDGKKRFNCTTMQLGQLVNRTIEILEFETDIKTQYGMRYLIKFRFVGDTNEYKFFTDSEEMKYQLDFMKQSEAFPVETTIQQIICGPGMRFYKFS